MKKLLVAASIIMALGMSSCKKSWNCVCTDGTNQITAETYKETKFLTAKEKCDSKQADVRAINPNASCSIK
ncbi:MAG: hypothetical protein JWN78_2914 [Bacteroidota bacterium]|nr:hypothetical protein [Bacteroidota bacterium]